MLLTINHFLGKWMPILTPLSVIFGILAAPFFHPFTFLVPWMFAFMTFAGSLQSNITTARHAIAHPLTLFVSLMILHVLTPLWAWGIGHLFFSGDMYTITGLILAVVIPTGITSVIWVSMYQGNIPIALAIILIDTVLSPLIVPYSIHLFVGQFIKMDVGGLILGLLIMIVIPTIAGLTTNQITRDKSLIKKLNRILSPFAKMSLPFIIAINSSSLAPYMRTINFKFLKITVVILIISISGFLFCWILSRVFKQNRENTVALIFTGGMRNISTGVVVAVSYFSPQVALPVVMGMLFQQTLAAVNGQCIRISQLDKIDRKMMKHSH
ncbi:bile acid:sodium symporter family protein [Sporolactobacillus laevolacticus]|uniref:bile acid:sodium symporter family protein n=1 Tax=Sporolactobacillus laevolacticus TaxID=33018 RepID=UPI0025B5A518|nr:bile acid:sodium symporter family protein [Sporolactobacillus laevolacticus]MDN3954822.1 bile acid:sodium symporter family protein [Sporolactobacillus laevolacticus]